MGHSIFTYGSLEFASVWRAVTGFEHEGVSAHLEDHARYRVRGATYPGIVVERGRGVTGTLHRGIDEIALQKLDSFEGQIYQRIQVRVLIPEERAENAWTYIVPLEHRDVLVALDWDPAEFERVHLASFIRRYTPTTARRRIDLGDDDR